MPYIVYKANASTAFLTDAAGILHRLVHISALCWLSFNTHNNTHTLYSNEFYMMSYMKALPDSVFCK